MHGRIGIGCPRFALRDPGETLKRLDGRIARWEMLAEDRCSLPGAGDRLAELLPSYDIELQVHMPFSDLNIASVNPAVREFAVRTLEDTIRAGAGLGVRLFTVHPGWVSAMGRLMRDTSVDNNTGSLRRLAKLADEVDVRLALENMPYPSFTLCNRADEIKEALDDVGMPGRVGFCLDVGHANVSGQTRDLLKLKDRLFNMHIHDNDGRRDQHLILGEGTVDYAGILARVLPAYKGSLVIEGQGTDHVCESQARLEEYLDTIPGWDD